MKFFKFTSEIFIIGVNPYVIPPVDILENLFLQAKNDKSPIPVKIKLNGKEFMQTLVKYQNLWRLYLNTPMRKYLGLDVGDRVEVEISYDASSREVVMHSEFVKKLENNKKAKEAFEKLIPSRRKGINRYLNNLKSKETLMKNIDNIIKFLNGEKVKYHVILQNKK